MRTTRPGQNQRRLHGASAAFTLLELLVVIGIIGILTYITLPALPGLKGGNVLAAASRQLMDDLALARQRAIAERTTVYVVFVPRDTTLWTGPGSPTTIPMNNLLAGQWTDYAIYADRTVGDQPGWTRSRYLTEWKSLPEDVFIPGWKFSNTLDVAFPQAPTFPIRIDPFLYTRSFRVPTETTSYTYPLPFIAFNSQGQVTSSQDEFIPLARGSVFPLQRDAFGRYPTQLADILESPPNNSTLTPHLIRISWLTGRAKVEQPQLP